MNRALLLQAQRRFTSPCDPDVPDLPARVRSFDERVEAGAQAIYGVVTRTTDAGKIAEKWRACARPKTKEDHRAEAEACIRASDIHRRTP